MSCFPYHQSNTGKYHWFLRAKLSGVNNSNIQSATELPAGVKVPQLVLASEPVPQSDVAFVSIVLVCTVSKNTCCRNEWYWFPEMKQLFSHMFCIIMWGLSTEGNLLFKIDWASLIVERKFTLFCFLLNLRAISKYRPGRGGAYIWRGDLTEGFCVMSLGAYIWRGLYMEGLIFGILRYNTGLSLNTTSRRGIKHRGVSFGSSFLLFSNKVAQGHTHSRRGKAPGS